MPLGDWLAFVAASFLLGITPGPDIAYVAARGAAQGWRAGVVAAAGLCTGIVAHTALAVAGLSAAIAALPGALAVLKLAGAAYILWIAWGLWNAPASTGAAPEPPRAALARVYRQTILMNLLNPKVGLFFVAFLPLFVPAGTEQPGAVLALLGATFLVVSFCVMSGAGIAGAAAGAKATGRGRLVPRTAALVLAGAALWLTLGR